jgi:multiple sugar transport system substrate-binding protein
MKPSRSGPRALMVLAGVVAILASACGGATTSSAPSAAVTSAAPSVAAASSAPLPSASVTIVTPAPLPAGPGPNGGVVVRWFIGLGAGTQPAHLGPEQAWITKYNTSQKDVYISVEIVDNSLAGSILKTEIAAGNPPDIIGPVGIEGLNLFRDQLQDLAPLVAKANYTQPGVDPKLADFFKIGAGGAQIGLPYAVYPSFLFYNKDLFTEAKLPFPPTKVGELYNGKPWDTDALRELAMKLTVDGKGNDATNPAFDPKTVEQWGFDVQYHDTSARAETAFFGAGSPVADDGKTAQIPDYVAAGEKWFNDGIWKDHFIPNANQVASTLLNAGGEFASGNLAMDEGHTWFTCCVAPTAPAKQFNFGFAVTPAYKGTTTAPLHVDTFSILKSTKVPDAAFKALTAMVASPELLTVYGAMPADPTKQDAWFKSIDASFPGIKLDWSIAQEALKYPDIPNNQSFVPNYGEAKAAFQAFQNKVRTTDGLDMDAELATLKTTLQGIFDKPAN